MAKNPFPISPKGGKGKPSPKGGNTKGGCKGK